MAWLRMPKAHAYTRWEAREVKDNCALRRSQEGNCAPKVASLASKKNEVPAAKACQLITALVG